jgi:hypothetical protein
LIHLITGRELKSNGRFCCVVGRVASPSALPREIIRNGMRASAPFGVLDDSREHYSRNEPPDISLLPPTIAAANVEAGVFAFPAVD